MAFNVLKDPSDPRNFIVTPAVPGIDPSLLAAGTAAGAPVGTVNRPAARRIGGGTAGLDPEEEKARFGGPGDPRQARRGLINLEGRLRKQTFENNKAFFEAGVERDGLSLSTPGLREALNQAYTSTGGFKAAQEVVDDFVFMSPKKVAQREIDLDTLQAKQTREADAQRATTKKVKNDNAVFEVTLGVPMGQYVTDKQDYLGNVRLADRVRDLQTVSERWGAMRGPTFTDPERAAVAQSYEDAVLELTIAVSQANQAGALSDAEFERFSQFLPGFGSLSSIQDSTRRVTLGNAFNIFKGAADDIVFGNRGLQKGSESVNFAGDIGEPRTWQQILFQEGGEKGDITVPPGRLDEFRERAGRLEAGQLGPVAGDLTEFQGQLPPPPGEPTAAAEDIGDFFTGLGDIVGESGQPMTSERRSEAAGLIGASVGAAAETAIEGAGEFQRQTSDEEERERLRRAAGR